MAFLVAEMTRTEAAHSDLNALLLGQGIHVGMQQGTNHRPRQTHRQGRIGQGADTSRCFTPPSPSVHISSCPSSKAGPAFSFTHRPHHSLASSSPCHSPCLPPPAHPSLPRFCLVAQTLTIWLVSSRSGLVENMFSSTAWTAHREPGTACSWNCTADPAWASLPGNPTLTWNNTPGKEYEKERGVRRVTDRWHRQKEED